MSSSDFGNIHIDPYAFENTNISGKNTERVVEELQQSVAFRALLQSAGRKADRLDIRGVPVLEASMAGVGVAATDYRYKVFGGVSEINIVVRDDLSDGAIASALLLELENSEYARCYSELRLEAANGEHTRESYAIAKERIEFNALCNAFLIACSLKKEHQELTLFARNMKSDLMELISHGDYEKAFTAYLALREKDGHYEEYCNQFDQLTKADKVFHKVRALVDNIGGERKGLKLGSDRTKRLYGQLQQSSQFKVLIDAALEQSKALKVDSVSFDDSGDMGWGRLRYSPLASGKTPGAIIEYREELDDAQVRCVIISQLAKIYFLRSFSAAEDLLNGGNEAAHQGLEEACRTAALNKTFLVADELKSLGIDVTFTRKDRESRAGLHALAVN